MGRIRILPDDLVSKIAAGEIVERPASIVKELVENSLDAGSSSIRIEVQMGGRKSIKVTDNGSGMDRDSALLSIESHATSKINSASDLFRLDTMGFRGEALPSIASISRFTLTSNTKDGLAGTRISIVGGKLKNVEEFGSPPGTSVDAKDIFYNTPARRKFLKTRETELGHVLDIVQRHAVVNPEIAFELVSDGTAVLRFGRQTDIAERLKEIWKSFPLYKVSQRRGPYHVEGFLSGPDHTRSNTQRLYVSVNSRPIKDRFITHIILQGYGRLVDKGRFPQGVLLLQIPSEEVDVNVHPTKNEVKFRDTRAIGDLIKSAIAHMLYDAPWIGVPRRGAGASPAAVAAGSKEPTEHSPLPPPPSSFDSLSPSTPELTARDSGTSLNNYSPQILAESSIQPRNDERDFTKALLEQKGYFSSLVVVGQLGRLYIVCESEGGAVLIDQHAAHERINYERIRVSFKTTGVLTQELLLPVIIELSPSEASFTTEHLELLASLGMTLEPFGGRSLRLRSVPAILSPADPERLVRETISELQELGIQSQIDLYLDHVIATMACHSSIRANQTLSTVEAYALLNELDGCQFPFACPHGRPVSREISFEELKKMFKRT